MEHVASDGTRTNVGDKSSFDLMKLMEPGDRYLREYAATLTVNRVWKGHVGKEMTVYFVVIPNGPFFQKDHRSIVVANRQTSRQSGGLDPAAPLRDAWVEPCSGFAWDNPDVLKLGRSRRPSS